MSSQDGLVAFVTEKGLDVWECRRENGQLVHDEKTPGEHVLVGDLWSEAGASGDGWKAWMRSGVMVATHDVFLIRDGAEKGHRLYYCGPEPEFYEHVVTEHEELQRNHDELDARCAVPMPEALSGSGLAGPVHRYADGARAAYADALRHAQPVMVNRDVLALVEAEWHAATSMPREPEFLLGYMESQRSIRQILSRPQGALSGAPPGY